MLVSLKIPSPALPNGGKIFFKSCPIMSARPPENLIFLLFSLPPTSNSRGTPSEIKEKKFPSELLKFSLLSLSLSYASTKGDPTTHFFRISGAVFGGVGVKEDRRRVFPGLWADDNGSPFPSTTTSTGMISWAGSSENERGKTQRKSSNFV